MALLGNAGYGATTGGMGTGVAVVGAYVLARELALAGGDHRTAFAAYGNRIRDFARGCQKTSGDAGPFLAPPAERRIRSRDRLYRIRSRDRMYRPLASRPMPAFLKRITERSATNITVPQYPG